MQYRSWTAETIEHQPSKECSPSTNDHKLLEQNSASLKACNKRSSCRRGTASEARVNTESAYNTMQLCGSPTIKHLAFGNGMRQGFLTAPTQM